MVTTASPPFLLGTMGSGIRADLAMSIPALAGVISFGYLVAAAASPLGGRLTHRMGPPHSLRLAGALTSIGVGLCACATTSAHLYVAFFAIGLANAVIQPASNGTLSGAGTGRSQGLLFGMVQSAIPAATLLAGLLLAALDDVDLWRRALWVLFALSLMPQCLIARRQSAKVIRNRQDRAPRRARTDPVLTFLLVAAFLGSAATTAVAVFGVASGLAGGLPPVAAATGQVLGSLCCIVGRIAAAWRWGHHQPHRLLRHIATAPDPRRRRCRTTRRRLDAGVLPGIRRRVRMRLGLDGIAESGPGAHLADEQCAGDRRHSERPVRRQRRRAGHPRWDHRRRGLLRGLGGGGVGARTGVGGNRRSRASATSRAPGSVSQSTETVTQLLQQPFSPCIVAKDHVLQHETV